MTDKDLIKKSGDYYIYKKNSGQLGNNELIDCLELIKIGLDSLSTGLSLYNQIADCQKRGLVKRIKAKIDEILEETNVCKD